VSFWQEAAASIFRPAAYAEFARQRARRALRYLVLIALPLALVGALRVGLGAGAAAGAAARAVAAGPDFRLTGGVLEFDAPQPYPVTVQGQQIGLVDTTGATDESYLEGRDNFFLFLRDRAVVTSGAERRTMLYSDLTDMTGVASRADLARFLAGLASWAWLAGLVWLAGSLAAKAGAALLLASLVTIVASARNRAVGWAASWGIACHALTLPLLLGFTRVLAGAAIRLFGLLYWGTAVVYAVAGVSTLGPAAPDPGKDATGL